MSETRIDLKRLMRECEDEFLVSRGALYGNPSKRPSISCARNIFYLLARELTTLSYREISELMGRQGMHSYSGIVTVLKQMDRDARLGARVARIRKATTRDTEAHDGPGTIG